MPATSTDIHQLLLQVEASVAVAERNIRSLSRVVNDESNNMDSSLGRAERAHGRMTLATNNARIAALELQHALRGSVDAYASGANITQILVQHITMLGQAAYFASDSLGAFGKFLGGPWALALTAAVAVIGTLISKHGQEKDSLESLLRKKEEDYEKTNLQNQANQAWARTVDGVIESIKKQTDELDKQNRTMQENIQLKQQQIQAGKEQAQKDLVLAQTQTLPNLLTQQSNSQRAVSVLQANIDRGTADETAGQALANEQDHLKKIQTQIANTRGQIAALQQQIQQADLDTTKAAIPLIEQNAQDMVDGLDKITHKYDDWRRTAEIVTTSVGKAHIDMLNKITAVSKQLGVELPKVWNQDTLTKYLSKLNELEQKEKDAYNEAHKKDKGSNSLIFDQEISSYYDAANAYRGKSETSDKAVLEALFNQYGVKSPTGGTLDPEKVAWCAAFVNAILGQKGATGSGSLAASSFLTYGKDDLHSPQQGDVVVVKNGKGGDHVGFLQSYDNKTGSVEVLGGNTSNKVTTGKFAANQVLAIRRPPTPSESAAAQQKATQEAADQAATFQNQLNALDDQLLMIRKKEVGDAQHQGVIAQQLIEAELKKYDDAVDKQVQDKKLLAADGDILKAKARELANEKIAEVQTQTKIKVLQETVKSQELESAQQTEHLRAIDQLAETQSEHRRLQLEMLDIEYKQKQASLELLKAQLLLAGKVQEAADVQSQINNIPQEKADQKALIRKSTEGPWQQYIDSLPTTPDKVNEQLQGIEVSGVQDLVNVLGEARHGWKAMRDAAVSALDEIVGKLVKLGLDRLVGKIFGKKGLDQQSIQDTIAQNNDWASAARKGGLNTDLNMAGTELTTAGTQLNAAGTQLTSSATIWQAVAAQIQAAAASLAAAGAAQGAGSTLGGMGGGNFAGIFGSLFGGGGAGAFGAADLAGVGGSTLGAAGGLDFTAMFAADGGHIRGPGTSTSDSIPIMGSDGEYMIQAQSVRKFGVPFFDALNAGKVPHLKGGGLLGALSFLSPVAMLATHPQFLKYLSPAAFAVSELTKGMPTPKVPRQSATAVHNYGDKYDINVTAPNTGNPARDRATANQQAAAIRRELADHAKSGVV